MRQRMQYLYVEIKKTMGMFPRMLLQAILLMALIGVIAFCGVKSMEREPLSVNVDIGVVVWEDNMMTKMALGYIENMESVSQLCSFVQVSEEEGYRMLERGEIAALMVLPEQLVEGIMNGENPAVDVVFPADARLEAMLFRELTESGAGLLRIAQAQIYGAVDTAVEYGLTERLSVMETEIDSYNLAFALDRLVMYDEETVSSTGRMSTMQYYVSSGIILFLLLSGIAAYPVMRQEPPAFRKQLKRQGTGMIWQYFCKWLCGFLCMGLPACVMWVFWQLIGAVKPEFREMVLSALISGRNHASTAARALIVLLVMITVTTFVYMVYSLTGSRAGSILLIFLLAVVMVYLSGGFIPSVFMPQTMLTVGDSLPTAYLIRAVGGLLAGYGNGIFGQCVTGMCIYTAVFGAISCLCGTKK